MSNDPYRWSLARRTSRPNRVAGLTLLTLALVVVSVVTVVQLVSARAGRGSRLSEPGLRVQWPAIGQAAIATPELGLLGSSGSHRPVPIASVAKVMTAYLVLAAHPIGPDEAGFAFSVTDRDVADTQRRRKLDQSLVSVRAGQVLTERQALQALLLPSANNMAAMLAVRTSGSETAFVERMNAEAAKLGMRDTSYTDPSGFDPGTVSTATDQVLLAQAALRIPTLAELVAQRSADLPVAGTVTNTDSLLGHDGFVGVKTGSDDAAGGCYMFANRTTQDGRDLVVVGVVLGQTTLADAFAVTRRLVDGLRPQLATAG